MYQDPLYFHRTSFAMALLESLNTGIAHAFHLSVPQRMGKTQFLLHDVMPVAQKVGFHVFYFSFEQENVDFVHALNIFANAETSGTRTFLTGITSPEELGVASSLDTSENNQDVGETLARIAALPQATILLLDEVQKFAHIKSIDTLFNSLRAGLDAHKNKVKVIFTGTHSNAFHAMFDHSKGAFFHFSHALDFPLLGKEFSDFLADIYHKRTQKKMDKEKLYQLFCQMHKIPLHLRSMIADMIIDPSLSLKETSEYYLKQSNDHAQYAFQWQQFTALEQTLIKQLLQGKTAFYKEEIRQTIADELSLEKISPSSIQAALSKLADKEIISKNSQGTWQIINPAFEQWVRKIQ